MDFSSVWKPTAMSRGSTVTSSSAPARCFHAAAGPLTMPSLGCEVLTIEAGLPRGWPPYLMRAMACCSFFGRVRGC